jgi:hypothetical protein
MGSSRQASRQAGVRKASRHVGMLLCVKVQEARVLMVPLQLVSVLVS